MKKQPEYFYYSAIHSAFPYTYKIISPKVRGRLDSVYIAECDGGRFVCKFNHQALAQKNAAVSKLMTAHGIPVPQIKLYSYKNTWFETYRLIPGKTLYELIGSGMAPQKVQHIYNTVLACFAKMSEIDTTEIKNTEYKHTHQVARANTSDANNIILGGIVGGGVRIMNMGTRGDRGLYHAGLTPKNMIVSPDGELAGLVDMDEVALCNKNYAFAMMAAKYHQMGLNEMDLINTYQDMTGDKLNLSRVRALINVTDFGKQMLWRHAQSTQQK